MVSEAGKTLKLLKSSEVHKLAYLLKNAHAIAKQNRPLTDLNGCAKLTNPKVELIPTDISKIQDNLSDIRSGNLEKLSDRIKT
jgi:hypothetical protein